MFYNPVYNILVWILTYEKKYWIVWIIFMI